MADLQTMAFALLAFTFMVIGRRFGWALSRVVLYSCPTTLAVLGTMCWGLLIAVGMRALLDWQQPTVMLRWGLGYALGAYVSIPNLGLLQESSIPPEDRPRHQLIGQAPLGHLHRRIGCARP